ncbi:MAG: cytochrome d ubiquinol oxidase subunit II [Polyangiaceae bacterium]
MTLANVWFWIAGLTFAVYAMLDGFDLGVGLIQPLVAKSPKERQLLSASIGPVWDGNEVWLLAAGGTLVFAFPKLYAMGLSGLYLPVTILLWLLAFRALGIEMRHHIEHPIWEQIWSVAFAGASLLVALFLSVALGNLVRGVSIDAEGHFFAALWTDFGVGEDTGILDWYTLSVGVLGVLSLGRHGALWIAHRTEGEPSARARVLAERVGWAVLVVGAAVTAATTVVQPAMLANLKARPWGSMFPLIAVGSLVVSQLFARRGEWKRAFQASMAFIVGAIGNAMFGVFPNVLPARVPERSLTAAAAATNDAGLSMGFVWWVPGMLLATGYFVHTYRRLPKSLSVADLDLEH